MKSASFVHHLILHQALTPSAIAPPPLDLTRLFQLPRSEVAEIVKEKYDIDGAFLVVFCAVVEQVANFPITGYTDDGRGASELRFERTLVFNKRGGFGLNFEEELEVRK